MQRVPPLDRSLYVFFALEGSHVTACTRELFDRRTKGSRVAEYMAGNNFMLDKLECGDDIKKAIAAHIATGYQSLLDNDDEQNAYERMLKELRLTTAPLLPFSDDKLCPRA